MWTGRFLSYPTSFPVVWYPDRAVVLFLCSVNFPVNCYQLSIIRDLFGPVAHAKEMSDVCGFVKTEEKEQAVMNVKMLTLHINWDDRNMKEAFNGRIKFLSNIVCISSFATPFYGFTTFGDTNQTTFDSCARVVWALETVQHSGKGGKQLLSIACWWLKPTPIHIIFSHMPVILSSVKTGTCPTI